jgi:hypothetical protein
MNWQMRPTLSRRWKTLGAGASLILVLTLPGLALQWARARHQSLSDHQDSAGPWQRRGVGRDLYTIDYPYEVIENTYLSVPANQLGRLKNIPDGPNREQFIALCRLCHSTRLILTQPRFPEKKWAEVVHKMVAVYGAPLLPEEEQSVVAYLTAVLGPEQ